MSGCIREQKASQDGSDLSIDDVIEYAGASERIEVERIGCSLEKFDHVTLIDCVSAESNGP